MGPFPQCRALGFSKRLTPRLLPRTDAYKYPAPLQGRRGAEEGLRAMRREAELPQCHPSSVLLWRSQFSVKYRVRVKSMVLGPNTGTCLFLAL